MKKFLTLLLVTTMILSLCACGGNNNSSPEKTIVGNWRCVEGPESFSLKFNEDGSGVFYIDKKSADITWKYVTTTSLDSDDGTKKLTTHIYEMYFDNNPLTMITEAGGHSKLMLTTDEYTMVFEKK